MIPPLFLLLVILVLALNRKEMETRKGKGGVWAP